MGHTVPPTSKAAHEYIKPHKPSHKQKIKEALVKLKVGGTHEEIALCAGLKPDQVWKRLSEAERDGDIFNTQITRKLESGVQGIVWQLTTLPVVDHQNPKTDNEVKALRKAHIQPQEAKELLKQTSMF